VRIKRRFSKYRNNKVTVDGIKFDSQKEAGRWLQLKLLKVTDLQRQVKFPIVINDQKICKYVADFTYYKNGKLIVEDVKSEFTKKLPVYRLKKKLLKAVLGIEITEI